MSKHTPEPWKLGRKDPSTQYIGIYAPGIGPNFNGGRIAIVDGRLIGSGISAAEHEANARHIVACVNACAGINPEAVPDVVNALRYLADEFDRRRMTSGNRCGQNHAHRNMTNFTQHRDFE